MDWILKLYDWSDWNMTTTIKIDEDDNDGSNMVRIEFNGSFELGESGLDIKDSIIDTLNTFNRIKDEMEAIGVFDGDDDYIVNVDEITKLIVNDKQLNDDELCAYQALR